LRIAAEAAHKEIHAELQQKAADHRSTESQLLEALENLKSALEKIKYLEADLLNQKARRAKEAAAAVEASAAHSALHAREIAETNAHHCERFMAAKQAWAQRAEHLQAEAIQVPQLLDQIRALDDMRKADEARREKEQSTIRMLKAENATLRGQVSLQDSEIVDLRAQLREATEQSKAQAAEDLVKEMREKCAQYEKATQLLHQELAKERLAAQAMKSQLKDQKKQTDSRSPGPPGRLSQLHQEGTDPQKLSDALMRSSMQICVVAPKVTGQCYHER